MMAVGNKNSAIIRIEKTYDGTYYDNSLWFKNKTFQVDIFDEIIEHSEEATDMKRIDYPKAKGSWEDGARTTIVDLLRVNENYTITGYLGNPTELHTWEATTLNGTINSSVETITLTDASSFPSEGMIIIEDEYIYYTGKDTNNLTGCQRGFFDTVAASHTTGVAIQNRTDGAVGKLAKLSFIKQHGGTVQVYMRNRKIECFMNKFNITDSKKENDGASQEPTGFTITVNVFRATLQ